MIVARIAALALIGLLIAGVAGAQFLSFGPNEVIDASTAHPRSERPRVVFTDDGVAHAMWVQGNAGVEQLLLADDPDGNGYGAALSLSGSPSGIMIDGAAGPTLATRGSWLAAGWSNRASANRAIYARLSPDMGATWLDARRADPATAELRAYQAVSVFPDGRLAQTWMHYEPGNLDPGYMWSADTGEGGFSAPLEASALAPGETCECCYPDHVILDDGQTVLVAFRNNDQNLREIHVARSSDGGATFSEDHRVDTSGWIVPGCPATGPSLAAEGDVVLCAWKSLGGGASHTYVARSEDGGATWAPMVPADGGDGSGYHNYPQIAIRDGRAVVTWVGLADSGAFAILAAASADGGVSWGPAVRVSDGTSATIRTNPDVAIAPDGSIDVVWQDNRTGGSAIYHSRGSLSTVEVAPVADAVDPVLRVAPNPVRAGSIITFELGIEPGSAGSGPVVLRVFDVSGALRHRMALAAGDPGAGTLRWDASAAGLSPGVYQVALEVGGVSRTRRVVVVP